ncbi:neuromedin-U receptor 1 [Colossoma macropomum]|uniref:neuromedin-U receptor 1 n=1 Tax=Colossoma macropomum TaxID=42526 RepID=UPI001863A8C7|nr:neuromedin-U receptor 1 [Colossoma macropomum]
MAKPNCSSAALTCVQDLLCNSSFAQNFSAAELEDYCLDPDEYLEKYLGPRRSPVFLPVCVTYLLIFSVGVMGNILTCTVITQHRVMRTPTNFYLFSLAVSDLLVLLLGMPLELYELWSNYPFLLGESGCYFKTFLFETVCFASILNVTALSVERYIAVVHPLRAKYVMTRTHARRVILCVWGVSVVCALPNTSLHGIFTLPRPRGRGQGGLPGSDTCMLVKPRWMYNLIIQITTLIFFLLPMLTLSVLYLLIGLRLRRERMLQALQAADGPQQDGYGGVRGQQQKARRQQVTKMLFVLVVMFGICWAPFHTDRLMWSFLDQWAGGQVEIFQAYEYVHVISGVFFYLSSAVNPILYNLMSTRFREMFKEVMCRHTRLPVPRKQSLSVTRVTLRSVVSEVAPGNGTVTADGDYDFYECHENETTFD